MIITVPTLILPVLAVCLAFLAFWFLARIATLQAKGWKLQSGVNDAMVIAFEAIQVTIDEQQARLGALETRCLRLEKQLARMVTKASQSKTLPTSQAVTIPVKIVTVTAKP